MDKPKRYFRRHLKPICIHMKPIRRHLKPIRRHFSPIRSAYSEKGKICRFISEKGKILSS